MQSPLTPQRGRIESNPREYTHMEPRLCDELAVMPLGSRCILAVRIARAWIIGRPPDERGNPDTRAWIFGRLQHESGFSDGISLKTPQNRPKIHSHFSAVRLSALIHHMCISHLSLVTNNER